MKGVSVKSSYTGAYESALILIDYDGLYRTLEARIVTQALPADFIDEIIYGVRKHLLEKIRAHATSALAFADFADIGDRGLQHALYVEGSEPRYVASSLQTNAAELQLTIEALETVHCRSDISTYLILSGTNLYLPLVQKLQAYSKRVLVIMPDPPQALDDIAFIQGNVYVDALGFVSENTRRSLEAYAATPDLEANEPDAPTISAPSYKDLTSPTSRHTLEIIEEHFGQYDEIYLTPLLRKLSEELDQEEYDPKTIIGELEDAGAIALEKRKGFPYDYTVLIVDGNHPDVLSIQQEFQLSVTEDEEEAPDYWEEAYAEEEEEYEVVGERGSDV